MVGGPCIHTVLMDGVQILHSMVCSPWLRRRTGWSLYSVVGSNIVLADIAIRYFGLRQVGVVRPGSRKTGTNASPRFSTRGRQPPCPESFCVRLLRLIAQSRPFMKGIYLNKRELKRT